MKEPTYIVSELHDIETKLNEIFKGVMSFSLSLVKAKAAQTAASKLRENPSYNKPVGIFYSNLMDANKGFVPLTTASIVQLWSNEKYSPTLKSHWPDVFDFLCKVSEAAKEYQKKKTETNIKKSEGSSNATAAITDARERKTKDYPLYSNWSSVVENITDIDIDFLYSHLRKDAVNNIYWKWKDGTIMMIPISEVSKGRQIVDDDDFWTRFMNDNAVSIKDYCQTILEKAYELQGDSSFDEETVVESLESRIENLVPHCISRQLSIQITYVKEGRGKDASWIFERFSLAMTGVKPALNRDNWCSVLQLNLLKFLDASKIGSIKQWHTKFADDNVDAMYYFDATGLAIGEKVVKMPPLPGPFKDFFTGKLVNPRMDLLRIATYIVTALDDDDKSRQALFLLGRGKDGKGCFARFLEYIFGTAFETINEENFVNRFGLETSINKRLICVQDAKDPTMIVESATFKSLTGGDPLFVDIKYRKPVCWHTEGTKVLITTNKFLWLNDEYSVSRVLPVFFQRNYDPLDIKSVDDITTELCVNSKAFVQWCYQYVQYFKQKKNKAGQPWKMNTKNGLMLLSDRQYELWLDGKLEGSWGDIQRDAFAEASPKDSSDDYFRVARYAEAIEDSEEIYRMIAKNYLVFTPAATVTRAELNIALRKAAYKGNSFELQAVGIDRYSKDCNKAIRGFIKWVCNQEGVTTSNEEDSKLIHGVRLKDLTDDLNPVPSFPSYGDNII